MVNPVYVLAYDIGTTGVKTCLFSITDTIELLAAASEGYNLYVLPGGGAEHLVLLTDAGARAGG